MKSQLLSLAICTATASALRGPVVDEASKQPLPFAATAEGRAPPDFNCFKSAWHGKDAEAACGSAKARDDSPCVWCSAGGGGAAGACLSNVEAIAANGHYGLACPPSIYVEPAKERVRRGLPDVNCFRAAWDAENAETACGESRDKDGDACVWCQTAGDAMGACLSKAEAGMADGHLGLKCPSSDEALE